MRGLAPPAEDFVGWLKQVITFRRTRTPAQVTEDIQVGLAESLRAGTTLLGDISGNGESWLELAEAPIRSVVFREMLGLTKERAERAWQDSQAWLGGCPATETCQPGLSPHAPYSARVSLIKSAASSGLPLAIHLAETRAERELLVDHAGQFVSFLQELGVWDPTGLAKSPEHVLRLADGNASTLLVHCNDLSANAPFPTNATVVYCPRTHAAFGHAPHPFREFLAHGIRVALGTDSLASNPDLSILNEMRFLHGSSPDLPGETILRVGTLAGAQALGWAEECGGLEAGKSADFVVLPLEHQDMEDAHALLLGSEKNISRLWIRGTEVKLD
jgi:cytosine/adenosine deaminase-related metal-dependent hydrolase